MTQIVFKVLVFCFTVCFLPQGFAADFKKMLSKKDIKAFVGTYQRKDANGEVSTLTIEEDEELSILSVHEQSGNNLNTLFELPLLLPDLLAVQLETLGTKPNIKNRATSYKINAGHRFTKVILTTDTDQLEREEKSLTLQKNFLTFREQTVINRRNLSRRDLFVPGKPSAANFIVFQKVSDTPKSLGELLELAAEAGKKLKKESSAPLAGVQVDYQEILNLEAEESVQAPYLPIPREKALVPVVKKTGEVVYWETPPKSALNFLEEGHSAKVISYEKFKKYQEQKACGQALVKILDN